MTTLGDAPVQKFLDTKQVVVLATVQPDGAPLAMAMWFLHDPAALTMISVDGLKKVHNLRRDPRVSVVAEAGTINDDEIRGRGGSGPGGVPGGRAGAAGAGRALSEEVPPAAGEVLGWAGDAGQPCDVPDRADEGAELGAGVSGASGRRQPG